MNLFVNTLIQWNEITENDGNPIVERVLFNNREFVVTINVFSKAGLPMIRKYDEMEGVFLNSGFQILEKEPFRDFLIPEESISEKHKKYRDEAWEMISEVTELPELCAYMPKIRGKLINDISKKFGKEKKSVYRHLEKYWKRGMTKNALLPRFTNCGGRGKSRVGDSANDTKLGKPSALSSALGVNRGIRITFETKKYFKRALRKFYENKQKPSLQEAYQKTLENYFNCGYDLKGDIAVPIIKPINEIPTFHQFRYYYETEYQNPIRETKARQGEINFQLRYRSLFGNSTDMAFGPGSLYQIDATIVDLYLVSSFDRSRIIGRPVLYLVIDAFSRMITGIAVLLAGPSWLGAMLALDNVVADKVEFCAEHGIEITEEQWNCRFLPEAILADRGEFEGYNADNLVTSLGLTVHNTSPYRGDLKGIVERQFRILNEKFVHFEPGAVIKHRERGEKDYRLDAALTLKEFRTLMITHILLHNQDRYLKSYRKDEFMIADNVERFPATLWNWGIQNRSGHLRTLPRDVVRMNLLPRREVIVTPQGLHFERELYYVCDPIFQAGLMMRKKGRKSPKVTVAYDPRTTDYVYLPSLDNREVTVCPLTAAAKTFIGRDFYESQAYFNQETQNTELSLPQQIQSRSQFHAIQNHVTEDATKKTSEALENTREMSARQRTKGIRENRTLENKVEQTKNSLIYIPQIDGSNSVGSVINNQAVEETYVSPTSNADKIREIRKQKRGGVK